jgi:transcriptional regulator GlxA family with amidase domain
VEERGPHRVVALALPAVVAFDLSIAAQVFGHRDERSRYAFSVCSSRPGPLPTSTGFDVDVVHGLDALLDADTVVVPGFHPLDAPDAASLAALRGAAARGARIASVCVGAFALAEAGLLDGRVATTHWEHAEAFRARFPRVRLNPDVLYVDDGQVLTSAGIAAGIDLCLHLVRQDHGEHVAAGVARRMVVATHRTGGQTQYAALEATALGVDEVAERCGFGSATTLRVHFSRDLGATPTAYRRLHRVDGG